MKIVNKLNLFLSLMIVLLAFLLIKQNFVAKKVDLNLTNESSKLITDFTSFRIQNIEYHLEVLETLQVTKKLEEVKKQIEITLVNLFFQHSITRDISNLELNQSSLVTLCRFYLYVRQDKFEKVVSNEFSEYINTYYVDNNEQLNKLYLINKINPDTCLLLDTPIRPDFKKLDSELQKLGEHK